MPYHFYRAFSLLFTSVVFQNSASELKNKCGKYLLIQSAVRSPVKFLNIWNQLLMNWNCFPDFLLGTCTDIFILYLEHFNQVFHIASPSIPCHSFHWKYAWKGCTLNYPRQLRTIDFHFWIHVSDVHNLKCTVNMKSIFQNLWFPL